MIHTAYLKDILHSTPIPSLVLKVGSPDFEIELANKAFLQFAEIPENPIEGQLLSALLSTSKPLGNYFEAESFRSALEKTVKTKNKVVLDKDKTSPQGKNSNGEAALSPIFNESGDIVYIICTVNEENSNFTHYDQQVAAKDKWSDLGTAIMVWEAELKNFQHTYVSPQSKAIFGYEPEEWYQANFWSDKVSPEDKDYVLDSLGDSNHPAPTFDLEYRIRKSDDTEIWVQDRISFIREPGKPAKFKGVLMDITNRKRIETEAHENRQKIRKILDHSLDIICIFDEEGRFIEVNEAARRIWGYSPAELKGNNFLNYVHPDDKERTDKEAQNIIRGNKTIAFENRYITKEGKTVPMWWSAHWDENEQQIFCVAKDATQMKEAERQLKYNEQRFKSLVQHGADFIAIMDTSGTYTYVSPTAKSITGWETGSLIGHRAFSFIHQDDINRVTGKFYEVINGIKEIVTDTFRILKKDGQYIWMETYAINMVNNPMINGIVINSRDVTERVRIEKELKTVNQRYELVTQATTDAIWDWDLIDNSVYMGGGFYSLFGYKADDITPHISDWRSRIHPKDIKNIKKGIKEIIKSDQNIWEAEYRFLKSNGEYNYVYDRGFVVRDSKGKAIRMVGAMQNVHPAKMKEVQDNLKLHLGHIYTHHDTIDNCLKVTLKAILQVHDASYAEIWMTNIDDSGIELKAHYGKGTYSFLEDQTRFGRDEGLPGKIWVQNQPKFIDTIEDNEELIRKEFVLENKYNCIVGYPIHANKKVTAVILFYYKKKTEHTGFFTFIQDILNFLGSEIQRKKAELELDHFFELSPDLMCITNVNGNFIKINEAFEVLLGYKKEEIIATNFIDLIHPDDRFIYDDLPSKANTGQIMDHESRMKNKSGDYLWLSWTAKPFPGESLIVAVGKDISYKKIQEEKLAMAYQKNNSILESIQDGFIGIEKDWTVGYWNSAAEKMVQIKREEIVGQNLWDILPETKGLRIREEFSRAMEENVSVRFDEYYKGLDLWLMVSAFPSDTGLTVYLKDITERKIALQKLIQFKNVIENSKEEIAIISTVNESIYLNPAFKESFGYGAEKLKQIGGAQMIFANETQAAEVFSDLLAGRHWTGDVELKNSQNKILSYFISSGPIYDDNGKLIAVFIIHTDISKRKLFEAELKKLYSNLQQQAKELANYREELDQFAQIASKDLNKPLRFISDKLKNLKTYHAEVLDEQGLEDIQHALNSSDRMQHLIAELLEYTLIEKGNGQYEKTDLNKSLEEAQENLKSRIHDKFALIDASKLPVLKGYKTHFSLIFKTIISTVLELYSEKPRIGIEVNSDSTHWLFSIRTKGSVIDPAELQNISDFLKKPDADMDVGKYIALATVRKIVGKYKGRLLLELGPGHSSIFYFTIAKNHK